MADIRRNNANRLAWQFYDGSNSIVHLIAITIVLPWAFDAYWETIRIDDPLAKLLGEQGDKAWGILATISLILAGITSLIVGKIADKTRSLGLSFKLSTIASIVLVGLCTMYFAGSAIQPFLVLPAAGLLIVFTLSLFLYDAMLIDAAEGQNKSELANISGSGWAIGYVISAGLLAVMWLLSMFPEKPDYKELTKIWDVVLFFFGALTIFILRFWPSEIAGVPTSSTHANVAKPVKLFLFACFLLTDAGVTIAYFVTLISKNAFHLTLSDIVVQFLMFHIIAIPATMYMTPWLIKTFSARRVCILLAQAWIAVCLGGGLLLFLEFVNLALWVLVLGMGILIGTTPAIIRALYAQVVPVERRGEFFSFAVITQRTFAFIGPALATVLLIKTGSYVLVLMSPLPLLVGAILVFSTVDFDGLNANGKS